MKGAVFFDLDGTLTDPATGITRSIQYAMEQLGVDAPQAGELTWCIGPPLLASLETLVGKTRAGRALFHYRERFSDVGWQENVPYPGVAETLACLKDLGLSLYVATSKPTVYAQRIIDHFGLGPFFLRVYGSELDGRRTDKRELLRFALDETRSAAGCVMIGDREHDILGALKNSMRAIGVTYGFGSRQELESAGAHAIADRPEELQSLLV